MSYQRESAIQAVGHILTQWLEIWATIFQKWIGEDDVFGQERGQQKNLLEVTQWSVSSSFRQSFLE